MTAPLMPLAARRLGGWCASLRPMKKPSPFTPGYGLRPPYLAGREAQQAALMEALGRLQASAPAQGIVMYGPRGMGKTVLLDWFEEECREAGAVPILTTPAAGLRSYDDLPRLLLPQDWLPDKVTFSMGNTLTTEWDIKDDSGNRKQGTLAQHLIAACKKTPRALLLDEAHTLEDAEIYRALLGTAQSASSDAPFLLMLAGTPGLMPHLMSVGATFAPARSEKIGVGILSHEAACDAIRIPLQDAGIKIPPAALDAIAEDCQCYPYFLQEWGKALWLAIRDEESLTEVTQEQIAAADEVFRQKKADVYADRYRFMADDKALLTAAHAVSERFQGKGRLNPDELSVFIKKSLADLIPDDQAREAKAVELKEELNRIDYFWYPPIGGMVEPGIPSFMAYISERYAEKQALEK